MVVETAYVVEMVSVEVEVMTEVGVLLEMQGRNQEVQRAGIGGKC